MKAKSLKAMWAAGKVPVNGWLALPNGFSAEIMASTGWDCLTIDLQHGVNDYATAIPMLQAIATTPTVPLARLPWLEEGICMKMLDAGAMGLICPMVNSAAEAARFVAACRYPPDGQRSFGPIRANYAHGLDYWKTANAEVTLFAMIETRKALDDLDAILKVKGLDAIYVGPADLANSLGYTPGFDPTEPAVVEAITMIVRKAKEAGKIAGIHNGTPQYALRMIGLGYRFVTISSDARFIAAGAAAVLATMRDGLPAATSAGY